MPNACLLRTAYPDTYLLHTVHPTSHCTTGAAACLGCVGTVHCCRTGCRVVFPTVWAWARVPFCWHLLLHVVLVGCRPVVLPSCCMCAMQGVEKRGASPQEGTLTRGHTGGCADTWVHRWGASVWGGRRVANMLQCCAGCTPPVVSVSCCVG